MILPRESIKNIERRGKSQFVNKKQAIFLTENLIPNMWETLKHWDGVGLTACQVGMFYKLSIYRIGDKKVVFFNGGYTGLKNKKQEFEGCLTYPKHDHIRVRRFKTILATYDTLNGDGEFTRVRQKLSGFEARVFQHETDHQNGKTIYM